MKIWFTCFDSFTFFHIQDLFSWLYGIGYGFFAVLENCARTYSCFHPHLLDSGQKLSNLPFYNIFCLHYELNNLCEFQENPFIDLRGVAKERPYPFLIQMYNVKKSQFNILIRRQVQSIFPNPSFIGTFIPTFHFFYFSPDLTPPPTLYPISPHFTLYILHPPDFI